MTSPALQNVRRLLAWGENRPAAAGHPGPQAAQPGVPSGEPAASAATFPQPAKIETIGIVGAGVMGRAVAVANLLHGLPVVLSDLKEGILADARTSIAEKLSQCGAAAPAETLATLLQTTSDPAQAARCDLVLEAIVESQTAKGALYAQLQPHLMDRTILASNTSTIPLAQLARHVANPAQFCGLHFVQPVELRPLVEIVRGPQTAAQTIAAATGYVRRIGRITIVADDGPGFVVNRLLFPYLGEALQLLQEETPAAAIELAAEEFGMALGPLKLMDEIGLDTTLQAGLVLAAAFPERVARTPLLVSMVKAGRLGKKSGSGFYSYPKRPGDAPDEEAIAPLVQPWLADPPRPTAGPALAYRLVIAMLLEATRILEERKVPDPRDIELAALFGLGFPAERGGLLYWADSLGPERLLALLPDDPAIAARFRPTPLLEKWVRGGGFYDARLQT